jgi:hypothetical protein
MNENETREEEKRRIDVGGGGGGGTYAHRMTTMKRILFLSLFLSMKYF